MSEQDELLELDRRDQELAKLSEKDRERFADRTEFYKTNHDGADPSLERQSQWIAVLSRHAQVVQDNERMRALKELDVRQDRVEQDRELKTSRTAEGDRPAQAPKPQVASDPIRAAEPSSRDRDYSELDATHEKIERISQRETRLQALSKQTAQWRDQFRVTASASDEAQNKSLTEQQATERTELRDRQQSDLAKPGHTANASAFKSGHAFEAELLAQQHLAERVGLDLRLLGQQLKEGHPVEAETCGREARQSYADARELHGQRQSVRDDLERRNEAAVVVRQQDQDGQSQTLGANGKDRNVTDAERGNVPADQAAALGSRDVGGPVQKPKDVGERGGAEPSRQPPGSARPGGGRSR